MDPDPKKIDALVKKDFDERHAKRLEEARRHRNSRLATVLCELHIVEWLARQKLEDWPTVYPTQRHRDAWQKAVSEWCDRNAKHWNMHGNRSIFFDIVRRGFMPGGKLQCRYNDGHALSSDLPPGLTRDQAVVAIWRLLEADEVEPSQIVFAKASEVPEAVVSVETLYPQSIEEQLRRAKTVG